MGGMDFADIIRSLTIYVIPIILAVTLHEAAHAYAAKWLGDDTAHRLGRTTLNPISHIDPIGTVVMPLGLWILSGGMFLFGYAKPVPVIEQRLRNPRADMPIVALAGPAANAVMDLGWAILFVISARFFADQEFFRLVSEAGIKANILFFAFNMLPILPLDGGRILKGMLPKSLAEGFARSEPYGFFIVLALAFAGGGLLYQYWINPVSSLLGNLIKLIISPLLTVFGLR